MALWLLLNKLIEKKTGRPAPKVGMSRLLLLAAVWLRFCSCWLDSQADLASRLAGYKVGYIMLWKSCNLLCVFSQLNLDNNIARHIPLTNSKSWNSKSTSWVSENTALQYRLTVGECLKEIILFSYCSWTYQLPPATSHRPQLRSQATKQLDFY